MIDEAVKWVSKSSLEVQGSPRLQLVHLDDLEVNL